MANLYKKFATNPDKEKDGIWVNYDDARFLIARAGGANTRFQVTLSSKIRPYKKQIASQTLSDEESAKIMVEVFVEGVLRGWENVEDENDNPLEFTRENAIKLLSDIPELLEFLREEAFLIGNFKDSLTEETVKN